VIRTWVLAYRIVIGFMWGTSDRETGVIELPTREACEAVRAALERLPPLAHGTLAIEPCREDSLPSRSPRDIGKPGRDESEDASEAP
jgi:hypothetical protein